jgi:tRNA 5-methylaminomethyl-2-thiouridine biosynthesis bifunctional protein
LEATKTNAEKTCGPKFKRPQSALIIGGGIAGACVAAALNKRGAGVTILEQGALASGASGNPAGIVSPRLDAGADAPGRLLRAAYLYAVDCYSSEAPDAFTACGVVRGEDDAAKAAKLAADPNLPEDWFTPTEPQADGINSAAAFYLPQAGLLDPARAVAMLTQYCTVKTSAQVAQIERREQEWLAFDQEGHELGRAEILILANGPGLQDLLHSDSIPLDGRRGAISIAPVKAPDANTEVTQRAISAGAYVFHWDGEMIFGATFDPAPLDQPCAPVNESDHNRNLDELAALSPQRAAMLAPMQNWRGRASMRVTTPDQLPVAGAAPDVAASAPVLERLRHGAISEKAIRPPAIPGLFILGGLGSRGLTTAPIMGEHVACLALGEPSPLSPELTRLVEPARFMLRKARHNAD